MRLGWVLLFASVMIAAACWLAFRESATAPLSATPVGPVVDATKEGEHIEPVEAHVARNPVLEATLSSSTTPSTAVERTIVTGRCVDFSGQELAGVLLSLDALQKRWSKAEDAPLAERNGAPERSFRAQSGNDGRFRFDVPRPDASPIQLVALAGPDRQEVRRKLEDALPAGELDLGDLVFEAGASIEGRVMTSSGKPLEGARVSALHAPQSCTARSDAGGRFVIGRLPAGRWPIEAKVARFLTQQHPGVEVGLGGAARGVEIVMEDAPFLKGRVVDTSDRPIALADVVATANTAAGCDLAVTADDGTFTVYLHTPPRRSRTVEITKKGWIRHTLARIPENKTDILVVMQPAPLRTFRVVDGETKAPIPHFWIQAVRATDNFKRMDAGALEVNDPDGKVVLDAVRFDHALLIKVEGRAPVQTLIEPDEPDGLVQTIPVFPEGVVAGRLVLDGAPRAGVEVHVVRTSIGPVTERPARQGLSGASAESAKRQLWHDTEDWLGRDRSMKTDEDGTFRFAELSPGSWNVSLRGPLILKQAIVPVPLGHGTHVELGDIAVTGGACIAGHVFVPPGLDPRYVEVAIGWTGKVHADERGDFRLEGLEPGKYEVRVEPNVLIALGGARVPVELSPGEEKRIELDLRESNLARVRVRLSRGGEPCSGPALQIVYAMPRPTVGDPWSPTTTQTELLVHPRVAFRVVAVDGFLPVAHSDLLTMEPGQRYDLDLTIETGRLEIQLPDRVQVPESGQLTISIAFGSPTERAYGYTRTAQAPRAKNAAMLEWSSNRIVMGDVAPGEYEVNAYSYSTRANKGLQLRGRARIVVGETCVVQMAEK